MRNRAFLLILPVLALASCKTKEVSSTEGKNTEIPSTTLTPTTTAKPSTTTVTKTNTMPYPSSTDPEAFEKEISIAKASFETPRISSKDEATYEDLFNLGNKVSISIDMEDSELKKLQADYETGYKSEIYRHCKSVTISLTNYENTFTWTYDDVGIRQKGNTSRMDVFLNGKLANENHFKLSFDETFDSLEAYGADAYSWSGKEAELKAREDREFLGLSGLDMKWNKNFDATHIKEIYAAKMYQACGLLSQEIGLTEFEINQIDTNKTYDMGLYTLYEPATKSMIKRHLKDDELLNFGSWKEEKNGIYGVEGSNYGDLYKCSWGATLNRDSMKGDKVGIGNLNGSYIPRYERKTNTDISYNDVQLQRVGQAVYTKDYDEISQVMDLEYFAAVEACNYFIGNPDDLRNDMNNYMIYIRRTDGKLITIPIDNDRCFGITQDWDPDGSALMYRGVMETKAAADQVENSPEIFNYTILSKTDNYSRQAYLAYIQALMESDWLKNETFTALYDVARKTYQESAKSDFRYLGFSLTDNNHTFNEYMTTKVKTAKSYFDGNDTPSSETSDGNYGSVYLIGSHIDWNVSTSKQYQMTYNGNGEYTIQFTVNKVETDNGTKYIKLKMFDGNDYSRIDWSIKDDKLMLDASGSGNSYKLSGVDTGSVVTLSVNTLTLEVKIEIQ